VGESYVSRWLGAQARVDHFVAVSEFVRAKMLAHGLAPERVTTLHNFVDPAAHAPATGPGEYALFAGRLERLKGVHTLLEASAEVPELPLWIAGDGEARPELERALASPRLAHVRLLGFLAPGELARAIAGARCAVVPSLWDEPFGLAALEALALARPVIASRAGGLAELVEDCADGFLVPPGDTAALAERLRWMARHASEAQALGQRGRRKVEERFSPAVHYDRLSRIYAQVLA